MIGYPYPLHCHLGTLEDAMAAELEWLMFFAPNPMEGSR